MKKIVLISLMFFGMAGIASAQGTWSQRADLGGQIRRCPVGFAIGNKGYVGLGIYDPTSTLLRDFWQFNPSNNSWTQVADFGGTARFCASAFVIGSNAYVGLGTDNYSTYNFRTDFWKYNPATNLWTQVTDFPGTGRYNAPAFVLGSKGFVGTGWDQTNFFNDFYEYNSVSNTWIQKTDFPGGSRQAGIGFSIGRYGYMGLGMTGSAGLSDMYKYDTAMNAWTPIAAYPNIDFNSACFILGNKAYVGTGSVSYPNLNLNNHYWAYDPGTNAWTAIADMPGSHRLGGIGFSIGNIGYCGMGYDNNGNDLKDFWQYAPASQEGTNDMSNLIIDIGVFPNPSNGYIKVSYSSTKNSCLELKVIDITGKTVLSESKNQIVGNNEFTIDISKQIKGIYFISLGTEMKKVVFE